MFARMKEYLFSALDENRVRFTEARDLVLAGRRRSSRRRFVGEADNDVAYRDFGQDWERSGRKGWRR